MASKYIKNNTVVNKTYVGQLIVPGEYYLVQDSEKDSWANHSTLLSDIGNGYAIVAKSDGGSDDITNVSAAINYLKGEQAIHLASPFPDNVDKRSFRGKGGTSSLAIGANTIDVLVASARYIHGAEVWTDDSSYGSDIDFSIVDVDNVLGYGAGTVLKLLGDTWQINPAGITKAFPGYASLILAGLYIRMKITVPVAANFYYNLYLHE